ncbi:MAG: glutamate--tRNA ligase [Acidobacteriota bacterium]|nr:glutamate--tRNA ligase [Acidobacteriota bacterium]
MIRTRFAPSPTGYLHIGGVRTALFNWLFARRHAGSFVLRIDDTDQERNIDAALQPILDGFRWLGIDWDEGPEVGGDHGPYFQSQRGEIHRAAVDALLESGAAYRDYSTTEEIRVEREEAQTKGRPFVYSRRFMAETETDCKRFEAEGRRGLVRLKMPREGVCRFVDLVRGPVEFDWAREQDHVIQRPDGTCLYHLASAVDDHEFAISHVIRAEEHLSNTPRHVFITESLGYELPEYAHLPYVAEPGSKNKLSKRKLGKYLKNPDFARLNEHGDRIAAAVGLQVAADSFNPVIVDFYREIGFLPEALLNYLLLLGWSLDDKTEFFSRQEMIDHFSLERVQRSPASFDPTKLWTFQEHHMEELEPDAKLGLVLPYLERAGLVGSPVDPEIRDQVAQIIVAAGDRIKAAGDILDYDEFFCVDDALDYDEKAFDKRIRKPPEARGLLLGVRERLAATPDFTTAALEEAVRNWVDETDIKLGQIIHALRVSVTGKPVGFGMFEILEILGRGRCLARIDRALARLDDTSE